MFPKIQKKKRRNREKKKPKILDFQGSPFLNMHNDNEYKEFRRYKSSGQLPRREYNRMSLAQLNNQKKQEKDIYGRGGWKDLILEKGNSKRPRRPKNNRFFDNEKLSVVKNEFKSNKISKRSKKTNKRAQTKKLPGVKTMKFKRRASSYDLKDIKKDKKESPINGIGMDSKIFYACGNVTMPGMAEGKPKTNQDSYIAKIKVIEDPEIAFLGVFDGHGINGHKVSEFLTKRSPSNLFINAKVFLKKYMKNR